MDICARAFKGAAAMLEDGSLERLRDARYAGWESEGAQALLAGATLEECEARVVAEGIEPKPRSGRQERLENVVNRFI